MKKTILSIFLIIALLFSQVSVFAFDDMNEERLAWANTAVKEMAEKGLIRGYEDGKFRPDNSVTKQETLVLISRVLGFTEKSSADYTKIASEIYDEALADYSTPYKKEISYLLYKGILSPEDLAIYASDTEASQPLKRYEAAVLLTKILERDLKAVESAAITISFDDMIEIPAGAKAYVNYVCSKGIMNGMGDNLFLPNGKLTRAMIATLLYRIIPVLDLSYAEGSMLGYVDNTLTLSTKNDETETYRVRSNVPAILDGIDAKLSDFAAGTKVRLTFSGSDVIFVEGISSSFETTVSGIYNGFRAYQDATVISIEDAKTGKATEYPISTSIVVIKNGKRSTINDLVKTDYITASIKAGKVIHVQAEDKTATVNGIIDNIVFEPEFVLNVEVRDEIIAYKTGDTVSVKRNGKTAELSSISAGDKVTLTLTYGIITAISATSSTVKEKATISEIVISNTPSIKVNIDGTTNTLFISRDAEIITAGGKTIYDLRLGDEVELTVEGRTATKISVVTSASTSTNVTGVVENVESSYGYIKLANSTLLIFTKGAKIQDSSGASMTLRQIKAGSSITAFGTATSGAMEASLIIVNK
ncbi:MAG: S-layer homology domain-containing protein [Monoglobales bacterium]